jgi:hypothetical protein
VGVGCGTSPRLTGFVGNCKHAPVTGSHSLVEIASAFCGVSRAR